MWILIFIKINALVKSLTWSEGSRSNDVTYMFIELMVWANNDVLKSKIEMVGASQM